MRLLWICLIVFVAAGIRIAYVYDLPDLLHSDMGAYDATGRAFAAQQPVTGAVGLNGYHPLSASTYYPPGYTWFVGLAYIVSDSPYVWIRFAQAAMGVASVWMVYVIGRRIFSDAVGLLEAGLFAIHLPTVYYHGLLLTETLFVFLMLIGFWLYLGKQMAWAGFLFGLACLVRPALLPAMLFLALPLGRRFWVLAICAFIPILPVTVRNFQIHGRLIPISTNFWTTFYCSQVVNKATIHDRPQQKTDAQLETEHRALAFEHMGRHWPDYLSELPCRFVAVWQSTDYWPAFEQWTSAKPILEKGRASRVVTIAGRPGGPIQPTVLDFPDAMRIVDSAIWLFCLPAAIVAWFVIRPRPWALGALLIPFLLMPAVASPSARYRIPAVPLVLLLGSAAMVELARTRQGGKDR